MIGSRTVRVRGFSLVELVIVCAILGILAAIAMPRFASASQGAGESALRADLMALRSAIDLYAQEHGGDWPGLRAAGGGVGPQTADAFERQLTWYTASNGDASKTRDATHYFGPYLQSIPPLPVGKNKGQSRVFTMNAFTTPGAAGVGYGWEYEHYFGRIRANCLSTEMAADGTAYCDW